MHALHFSLVINIFFVVYIACNCMMREVFLYDIFSEYSEEFKLCVD